MNESNEKIKEIYEKYEKEVTILEEKYKNEYDKKKKLRRRKYKIGLLVSYGLLFLIITIPIIVLFINFGIKELGWFDSHKGMYKTELPIETPARGGTLYLPNDWMFIESNGWYSIIDKESNNIIAFEVFHGYEEFIKGPSEYKLVNYELNPLTDVYAYDEKNIEYLSNGSNNCYSIKNNDLFGLYFYDMCYYKGRRYSRMYLFISNVDYSLIKRIENSYSWGGEIE